MPITCGFSVGTAGTGAKQLSDRRAVRLLKQRRPRRRRVFLFGADRSAHQAANPLAVFGTDPGYQRRQVIAGDGRPFLLVGVHGIPEYPSRQAR
jgi:hypothetical protein